MVDGDEEHPMSTFARLNTQEVPAPRDFSDFWQEPASSFLASGRRAAPALPALLQHYCSIILSDRRQARLKQSSLHTVHHKV